MRTKLQTTEIDAAVWDAHCRADLSLQLDVDGDDWSAYVDALRQESRGYWHGMTGRLFERMGLPEDAWMDFVRLHQPEPPRSLGDSSMDLFGQVRR